ncbi:MAG: hypothetical protein GX306_12005 [Clostridiales bacterium]|jgi:ribosomal protein L14E/L6E/L27E|nr:hypothetical protein [Clostridiales bacterium]
MLDNILIGRYALSKAGHDSGKWYVIIETEREYVYLVDGKIRTIDRPKKKKMKHVNITKQFDPELVEKIMNKTVRNEEIKRALKLFQDRDSSKEVV